MGNEMCGTCCSPDKVHTEHLIDTEIKKRKPSKQQKNVVKKILLLGAGNVGKTTIFKQLRKVYGNGYDEVSRKLFISHIWEQIINDMHNALAYLEEMNETKQLSQTAKCIASQLPHKYNPSTSSSLASDIKSLWTEEILKFIHSNFELRAKANLKHTSAYFWNDIDRISHKEYVPNDTDLLYVHHRTTGLVEQDLKTQKGQYHVFDTGGQRSERKKWKYCFEKTDCVIFVASLSHFNEMLFEDDSCNALSESIDLFETICKNEAFEERTTMILLLNKKDLFALKIMRISITLCPKLSEFKGESRNLDENVEFIKDVFVKCNSNKNRKIFCHITCAVDTNDVEFVWKEIENCVLNVAHRNHRLV